MNTEKKPYEKACAEVVCFDNSDVITTSGSSVQCGLNVFGVGGGATPGWN